MTGSKCYAVYAATQCVVITNVKMLLQKGILTRNILSLFTALVC